MTENAPASETGLDRDMQDRLLMVFLEHVPFDGWSRVALQAAGRELGYDAATIGLVFDGGMRQVAEHFADWSDRRMLAELEQIDVGALKIRDRIHTAVKVRLQINTPHREAVRRLASFLALPGHAVLTARLAWRSSSVIWYWSGDRSADWNHYSKRGLLASVYTSTILYWLADEADETGDYPQTWDFLSRRIGDVLRIFGLPARIKKSLSRRASLNMKRNLC